MARVAVHACKTEQDETTIRAKTKVHRARSDEERWWRSCWVCAMLCSSRLGAGGGVCAMRAHLRERLVLFLRCVGGQNAQHQRCVQHFCKSQQICKWSHDHCVHGSCIMSSVAISDARTCLVCVCSTCVRVRCDVRCARGVWPARGHGAER